MCVRVHVCVIVCVQGSHVEFSSSARRRRDVCEQKTRNKSTNVNVHADIANDGVARLLSVCACVCGRQAGSQSLLSSA